MRRNLGRHWPLTARGTGALALAVACFAVAHEAMLLELLYFGVLLSAVLVVSLVALWLAPRIDAVTRSLSPEVATVGRASAVTVVVTVRGKLPHGAWDDAVSVGLEGTARGILPVGGSLARGEDSVVEVGYPVSGVVRGIRSLGPFSITTSDPFGLVRRRVVFAARTPVTVAPRVVDLPSVTASAGETGGTRETITLQLGQGADNLVARPYAPGDSMRRIHWRATAHRDTLMVRQEEQEASPEATVVFDRGAGSWGPGALGPAGLDDAFETGISAALAAVARLVHDGFTVAVIDSDGTTLSPPVLGGEVHEVDAVATQFATLTARTGGGIVRTASLFADVHTGPVIVVTGRLTSVEASALAPLAHRTSLAVIVASSPSADAFAHLRARGWRTVSAVSSDDLPRAWQHAMSEVEPRVGV